MTAEYKTWIGAVPYVIVINLETVNDLLYYETGFEQLHPLPEIHKWMEERDHEYMVTWKAVRIDRKDWAICFNNSETRDLFALRWL